MGKFRDFNFYESKSWKVLKERAKKELDKELTSMQDAYTFTTSSASPQDFFEELLETYWTEEQVPLLEDKQLRYIMAQIHAMMCATWANKQIAEKYTSKIDEFWKTTPSKDAEEFCNHYLGSKGHMTYDKIRRSDHQKLAASFCTSYKRSGNFIWTSLGEMDVSFLKRAIKIVCLEQYNWVLDKEKRLPVYTENMVEYMETIRVAARRKVLM